MGRAERVSIIGESVLMEGIVVSLQNNTRIIVQHIDAEEQDALRHIAKFKPEVIIYALGHPEIERLISQIRMEPDVRLIGLDLACNQALVSESHLHRFLSLEDLHRLIGAQGLDFFESIKGDLPQEQSGSRKRVAG
jgi:hypothetical protein